MNKPKYRFDAEGRPLTPDRIRGLRESYKQYRMKLVIGISDDGEGFLYGSVLQPRPCGCKVTGNGTMMLPLTVVPCKKHAK